MNNGHVAAVHEFAIAYQRNLLSSFILFSPIFFATAVAASAAADSVGLLAFMLLFSSFYFIPFFLFYLARK